MIGLTTSSCGLRSISQTADLTGMPRLSETIDYASGQGWDIVRQTTSKAKALNGGKSAQLADRAGPGGSRRLATAILMAQAEQWSSTTAL
jgi:hypothetical protein